MGTPDEGELFATKEAGPRSSPSASAGADEKPTQTVSSADGRGSTTATAASSNPQGAKKSTNPFSPRPSPPAVSRLEVDTDATSGNIQAPPLPEQAQPTSPSSTSSVASILKTGLISCSQQISQMMNQGTTNAPVFSPTSRSRFSLNSTTTSTSSTSTTATKINMSTASTSTTTTTTTGDVSRVSAPGPPSTNPFTSASISGPTRNNTTSSTKVEEGRAHVGGRKKIMGEGEGFNFNLPQFGTSPSDDVASPPTRPAREQSRFIVQHPPRDASTATWSDTSDEQQTAKINATTMINENRSKLLGEPTPASASSASAVPPVAPPAFGSKKSETVNIRSNPFLQADAKAKQATSTTGTGVANTGGSSPSSTNVQPSASGMPSSSSSGGGKGFGVLLATSATTSTTSSSSTSTIKNKPVPKNAGTGRKLGKLNQFDFIRKAEMDMQTRPANWRAEKNKTLIPMSEVAKHNKRHDAWMVLGGNVYDVTSYMAYHPGGKSELMRGIGTDATQIYNDAHAWVSWDGILKSEFLGKVSYNAFDNAAATSTNMGGPVNLTGLPDSWSSSNALQPPPGKEGRMDKSGGKGGLMDKSGGKGAGAGGVILDSNSGRTSAGTKGGDVPVSGAARNSIGSGRKLLVPPGGAPSSGPPK
ncbi:unnamed protein product [Amoebophrya sp. A25]|nr:unnamed protein product [Amoebophrya sp. A25]|eukprot:GSA25T00003330001.1